MQGNCPAGPASRRGLEGYPTERTPMGARSRPVLVCRPAATQAGDTGQGHIWFVVLDKVALRISQDYVADRLVIFDVACTAAEVTVQRFGDGLLEIGSGRALLRQPFEQHLSFVEKARGAVAALKGEVLNEGLLQD